MKKQFILFCTLIYSFVVNAQTLEMREREPQNANLNGSASIVFVSNMSDLKITVPKKVGVTDTRVASKKDNEGRYHQEFILDVQTDKARNFTLAHNAVQTNFVKKDFRPNERIIVQVNEITDNLRRLEIQEQGSPVVYNGSPGDSYIEILTIVPNLSIKHPYWKIMKKKLDAKTDCFTMTFNSRHITKYKEWEAVAYQEVDFAAITDEKKAEMTAAQDSLDKYASMIEAMKESIVISGAGIKEEELIYSMWPTRAMKQTFSVVEITKTIEKESTYAELLAIAKGYSDNYETQNQSAYFVAGADAYEAVLNHADCPVSLRDSLNIERNKLLEIRKFTYFIEKADDRWQSLAVSKGFEHEDVFKYLNGARNQCSKLIEKYPEMKVFHQRLQELERKTSEHPMAVNVVTVATEKEYQVIEGRVTKGEGWFMPIEGLRVYGVHMQNFTIRDLRKYPNTLLDRVKNGTYKAVLKESFPYLYFEGEKEAHPIDASTTRLDIELSR